VESLKQVPLPPDIKPKPEDYTNTEDKKASQPNTEVVRNYLEKNYLGRQRKNRIRVRRIRRRI